MLMAHLADTRRPSAVEGGLVAALTLHLLNRIHTTARTGVRETLVALEGHGV